MLVLVRTYFRNNFLPQKKKAAGFIQQLFGERIVIKCRVFVHELELRRYLLVATGLQDAAEEVRQQIFTENFALLIKRENHWPRPFNFD